MAGSAQFARIKSDVLAITTKITLGRVATHKQIGQHLKVEPRHVAYILSTLDAAERTNVPWWRVVADGGAIGRHLHRDDQMAQLRAEGVVLSPVGIVQDLEVRKVASLAVLMQPGPARPEPPLIIPASRARGMRDKPVSSIWNDRPD